MQVVLAVAVAAAAAEADPQVAYANGLAYGHAYAGFAGYPTAYAGYAAPAYAAAPVAHAAYAAAPVAAVASVAHAVPAPYVGTPVAHGLGLPEAATYVAPPVRTVAEAPIVEQVASSNCLLFLTSHLQVVEPVEQWGYKVAY